jgi:hypothetical protein
MATISFDHSNPGFQVGINHGSIYLSQGRFLRSREKQVSGQVRANNSDLFSERSETRPEPLSTVPFPQDPDFVGRNDILSQIHEKASIAGSRVALVGLGGVG